MGVKILFSLIFILVISLSLFFYLAPFNTFDFKSENNNFSIIESNPEMQFYSNLRFPSTNISYKISDCSLQKQDDMKEAFNIVSNLTSLKFIEVKSDEEISIFCEEKNRYEEGLFIAGEGGPVNITIAGNFNVISKGEILLIRHSNCPKPNIAIHELLHVLGFKHSNNKENIMYNITKCDQSISNDIIETINNLYSIPNEPDLVIKNISGEISGRFLDITFSVINEGFKTSSPAKVIIYADTKNIDEVELPEMEVGSGRMVYSENIWLPNLEIEKLILVLTSDFEEINKENNQAELILKK